MTSKKKINGNEPATQHDLSLLGGQLTSHLDHIEKKIDKMDGRLDKMDGRIGRLESGQKAILNVLNSIDIQLKEHKTHPNHIKRLACRP